MKNFFKVNKFSRDFISKLLFVLLLDYIGLFCAEAVLPGFVMGIFNLNWLLLAIAGLWLILIFFPGYESEKNVGQYKSFNRFFVFLVLLLFLVLIIVLYRASFLEIILYPILAVAIGKLFLGMFEE